MGDPNSWREPMILSTSTSLEDICLPTSRTKWPRNYCVMIALSTWGSRDTCRQTSVDELLGISAGDSLEISAPGFSSSFLGFLDILRPGGSTSGDSSSTFGCLDPFWDLDPSLGSSSFFLEFPSGRDNDFSGTGSWSMDLLLVQRLNVNT